MTEAIATAPLANEQTLELLKQLTAHVAEGDTLDELLTFVFDRFHHSIPYNRIGYAFIDEIRQRLITRWQCSDRPLKLERGFSAPLTDSSLPRLLQAGNTGIIGDLVEFAEDHAHSEAARLLVEEGMRSTLTCPLIVHSRPIGCLFFASDEPGTYSDHHSLLFEEIAAHLALHVDRRQLSEQVRVAREETLAEADRRAVFQALNLEIAQQLDLSQQYQVALLPHQIPQPAGYRIAGGYRLSNSVGGCYYDVLSLENGELGLFVADCTGHGAAGLASMAILRTIIRSHNWKGLSPHVVLASVDSMCRQCFVEGTTATGIYAKFDARTGTVAWSDAAHPPPLLVRPKGYVVEEPPPKHKQPLGLTSSEALPDEAVPLGPGDKFVVYTKALADARAAQGEKFGRNRMQDVLKRCANEPAHSMVDHVLSELDAFLGASELDDDVLLLVVERCPDNLEISANPNVTQFPWRGEETIPL